MSAKTVHVDLPAAIFDVGVNISLIHQVVVAQQAAARQGTHSTKRRGEVRGGGRKPYKQKGTGRARQGSTRAPQFTGGGIVHGPKPRSYDQRTPKKMKAAALRGALSDRARNGRIHVVQGLVEGDKPSTKSALAALASLTDRVKFLVVLERSDTVTWLSLRNAPEVHIVAVDQLNTYDVLYSDDIVFTKGSYDAFVSLPANDTKAVRAGRVQAAVTDVVQTVKPTEPEKTAEVVTTQTPAEAESSTPVPVDENTPTLAPFTAIADSDFAGAAQPGEGGAAPEGYEIKGNKDSMLYHAPGGRWYDATIAEVW
ncbi:MAG: 50S ribosomal protein L4, partial [Nocardioides sp.]